MIEVFELSLDNETDMHIIVFMEADTP